MANEDFRKRGLQGVSSGSPPASAGYAFKLMMEVLTGKRKLQTHNIEYPLPWVPGDQVRITKGDRLGNGYNAFAEGIVPSSFVTEVFDAAFLPEISLTSALNGKPTPGATIQPLPAQVTPAPDEPNINCQNCKPPADHYKLTKVTGDVKP